MKSKSELDQFLSEYNATPTQRDDCYRAYALGCTKTLGRHLIKIRGDETESEITSEKPTKLAGLPDPQEHGWDDSGIDTGGWNPDNENKNPLSGDEWKS